MLTCMGFVPYIVHIYDTAHIYNIVQREKVRNGFSFFLFWKKEEEEDLDEYHNNKIWEGEVQLE